MTQATQKPDTPVERIRGHAERIKKLLNSEKNKLVNARIWRAIYEYEGRAYAISLHQLEGQPVMAQIQLHADQAIPGLGAALQIQGVALTVEEMAVFLSLDRIRADALTWVEHQFDTKGIAIVHSSLKDIPGLSPNGR